MSLLKEQPTNRRAGRFAGRTSFARPSNRWICSASTQNSATCPQVPPAGTRAGLWAGRPVGALHTQMNELSTSNTSLPTVQNKTSPSTWKMPQKVFLKLLVKCVCDNLNLQWISCLSAAWAMSRNSSWTHSQPTKHHYL